MRLHTCCEAPKRRRAQRAREPRSSRSRSRKRRVARPLAWLRHWRAVAARIQCTRLRSAPLPACPPSPAPRSQTCASRRTAWHSAAATCELRAQGRKRQTNPASALAAQQRRVARATHPSPQAQPPCRTARPPWAPIRQQPAAPGCRTRPVEAPEAVAAPGGRVGLPWRPATRKADLRLGRLPVVCQRRGARNAVLRPSRSNPQGRQAKHFPARSRRLRRARPARAGGNSPCCACAAATAYVNSEERWRRRKALAAGSAHGDSALGAHGAGRAHRECAGRT